MKKVTVPQSGSQGDTTASRNRFGQYDRQRSTPTQPRTSAQLQVRAWLSEISKAWSALTDAQRTAWNLYGRDHPQQDSLGQTVALTGHQSYVGVNISNKQAGVAVQSDPPSGAAVASPVLVVNPTTAAGVALKASVAIPADTNFIAFASPPMSAGRSFNGNFRVVNSGVGTNTANQVLVSQSQLSAKFGTLVAGRKVFFQVVCVKGGNSSATVPASVVLT